MPHTSSHGTYNSKCVKNPTRHVLCTSNLCRTPSPNVEIPKDVGTTFSYSFVPTHILARVYSLKKRKILRFSKRFLFRKSGKKRTKCQVSRQIDKCYALFWTIASDFALLPVSKVQRARVRKCKNATFSAKFESCVVSCGIYHGYRPEGDIRGICHRIQRRYPCY